MGDVELYEREKVSFDSYSCIVTRIVDVKVVLDNCDVIPHMYMWDL